METKICKKCGVEKPLNTDNFCTVKKAATKNPRNDTQFYFANQCRECKKIQDRAYQRNNRATILPKNRARWAANAEQTNTKRRADPKHRAYAKKYYQEHKEERLAYNHRMQPRRNAQKRARRLNDPERYRLNDRQSHAKNKRSRNACAKNWQKVNRQYFRDYYQKNIAREQEKARRWAKAHPEKCRENAKKRRARILNAPEIETVDRMALIARDGFLCYLCGKDLSNALGNGGLTVDHVVPLTRGGSHTMTNLRICCRPCNSRKHNRTLGEFINLYPPSIYPALQISEYQKASTTPPAADEAPTANA